MKVDETVIELDTAHNVHENLVKIDRWRVFHPDWAVYVTRGSTIYEGCFKKEAKLSALASSVKNDDENPIFEISKRRNPKFFHSSKDK